MISSWPWLWINIHICSKFPSSDTVEVLQTLKFIHTADSVCCIHAVFYVTNNRQYLKNPKIYGIPGNFQEPQHHRNLLKESLQLVPLKIQSIKWNIEFCSAILENISKINKKTQHFVAMSHQKIIQILFISFWNQIVKICFLEFETKNSSRRLYCHMLKLCCEALRNAIK